MHLVVGVLGLTVVRVVYAVVADAGHEALTHGVEAEDVVHQLADAVDVLVVAGKPPVEHHRVCVLALGGVAAPPAEGGRGADGIGVHGQVLELPVSGLLQCLREDGLYGRVGRTVLGQEIGAEVGRQPGVAGEGLGALVEGIDDAHDVLGVSLHIIVVGLLAGHQVHLDVPVHVEGRERLAFEGGAGEGGALHELLRALRPVRLDDTRQVHEQRRRPCGGDLAQHLGAEEMVLAVIGGERRITGGLGAPGHLARLGLHILPEHRPPLGLIDDVGDAVALAQDIEILVELVGDVELVVREELGEHLVSGEK